MAALGAGACGDLSEVSRVNGKCLDQAREVSEGDEFVEAGIYELCLRDLGWECRSVTVDGQSDYRCYSPDGRLSFQHAYVD